ncbi:methyltransferase domain-containing protein [Cytophagaceae bacterium ABcell3]|nr:methyltransferase domain-containing protein [Cytophagaceae bacterium ABcell3]
MKHLISFIIRKVPRKYLQKVSHFVLGIVAFFYRGNKVEDPVSGKTYRKFLPYGRIPRENALCPGSLTLERHRLMWLYLKEKTNFFTANLKVLHMAPEYCFIKRFEALKNLDYITADIESPLAKVKMDVHDIPFPDNTFDVCFCNHVMEHVTDDLKAMSEIYRVLKPGGWAIIQSPIDYNLEKTFSDPNADTPAKREKVYGQSDHVRQYGTDYGQILQKAGFTVKEDKFVMEMPEEKVKRYALPAEEIIYFCSKN